MVVYIAIILVRILWPSSRSETGERGQTDTDYDPRLN